MPNPKHPPQVSTNPRNASSAARPGVIRVFGCPPVLWADDNDDCLDQDIQDLEELCCQEALEWNLAAHNSKYPPFLNVDPEAGVVYMASTNGKQSVWRCPHSGQYFAYASDGLTARMLVDDGQYIQWIASQVVSYEVLEEEVGQLKLLTTPSNAATLGPCVPASSQAPRIGPMHPETRGGSPDSPSPAFSFDSCSALFQQGDQAVHIAQGPNGACQPMLLFSNGYPIIAPPGSLLLPMDAAMSLLATSSVPPPTHLPARGRPSAVSPPQPPGHSRAPSSVSSAGSPGGPFYYQSSDTLASWGGSSVGTGHPADGLLGGPLGSWEMKPSSRGPRAPQQGSGASPPVGQAKPAKQGGERARGTQRTGVGVSSRNSGKAAQVSNPDVCSDNAASPQEPAAAAGLGRKEARANRAMGIQEGALAAGAADEAADVQDGATVAKPALSEGPAGESELMTTTTMTGAGEPKAADGGASQVCTLAGASEAMGVGARTPAAAAPAGAIGSPEPAVADQAAPQLLSSTQAGHPRRPGTKAAATRPPAGLGPQNQPGMTSQPYAPGYSFPAPPYGASTSYTMPPRAAHSRSSSFGAGMYAQGGPGFVHSPSAYGVHGAPHGIPVGGQPGMYHNTHMPPRTASAPGGSSNGPLLSTASGDHRRWSIHGGVSAPPLVAATRGSTRPPAHTSMASNNPNTSSAGVARHSRTDSSSTNSSGGALGRRTSMRGGTADRSHGGTTTQAVFPAATSGTAAASRPTKASHTAASSDMPASSAPEETVICLDKPVTPPLPGPNTLTVQLTTDDAGAALSITSGSGAGPAPGGIGSNAGTAGGFTEGFEISERLMSLAGIHGAVVVVNVNPVAKAGSSLCSSPCKTDSRAASFKAASPLVVSSRRAEEATAQQMQEVATAAECS